jgi:hypothetical protein
MRSWLGLREIETSLRQWSGKARDHQTGWSRWDVKWGVTTPYLRMYMIIVLIVVGEVWLRSCRPKFLVAWRSSSEPSPWLHLWRGFCHT